MMFAKKAGVSLSAQALLQNEKCVTPSLQPSAQLPTPTATSQEDDLHHAKRSSQVASPDETSCAPPSASHGEGSTSDQGPPESSNPAKTAISEPSPNPHKLTITTEAVSSRPPVVVKRKQLNCLLLFFGHLEFTVSVFLCPCLKVGSFIGGVIFSCSPAKCPEKLTCSVSGFTEKVRLPQKLGRVALCV